MLVPDLVTAYPGMGAPIGRQAEYIGDRQLTISFDINETDSPLRILLCHRANQAMHACVSWIDEVMAIDRLRLGRDHSPTQRVTPIADAQERLDQAEALQHAAPLLVDDGVFRRRCASVRRREPDDV